MKDKNETLIAVCIAPELGFKGNAAAVILLEEELAKSEMQAIAKRLNQPATTFLWPQAGVELSYHVRWFAPDAEIGLCGHGSLAAFAFLHQKVDANEGSRYLLQYEKGVINGKANSQQAEMELDGIPVLEELKIPETLKQGLGIEIEAYYRTNNKNIVLVKNEHALATMKPDFAKLRESDTFGYTVTAKGNEVDFVSRTLVPHVQQLEDHATGSSHAALTPFWSTRLSKTQMVAHQLSPNGGKFWCTMEGEKVVLKSRYRVD